MNKINIFSIGLMKAGFPNLQRLNRKLALPSLKAHTTTKTCSQADDDIWMPPCFSNKCNMNNEHYFSRGSDTSDDVFKMYN